MANTNVVQKDLGPVSAYAIAVKHGYKGTEEEWAALQIASAENAKAADASAKEAAETLAAVHETVEQETNAAVAAVNNQETASIQSVQDAAKAAATQQVNAIAAKGEATLESIPDDYTKLGQDVAALTEEISRLSHIEWTDGEALMDDNVVGAISGFSTSNYIPICEGITVRGENLYTEPGRYVSMVFVDMNYHVLKYSNEAEATAPAGAAFVRFGKLKATTNASVVYDDYLSVGIISKLNKEIAKQTELHLFGQMMEWTDGMYVRPDGRISPLASTSITQYLPCVEGATYKINGLLYGASYSAVAYYDENKTFVSSENEELESYTIPQGARYVVFCKLVDSKPTISSDYSMIAHLERTYKAQGKQTINTKNALKSADLSTDMVISTPTARWGYEIDFHARVGTVGELIIGKSIREYGSAYVRITDTMLYICMYANDQEYILNNGRQGSAHGLTISDEITVRITAEADSFSVALQSLGQTFMDDAYVQGNGFADSVKATTEGGSYSNCELSYYCKDINNNVWVCADSYSSYWGRRAYGLGYTNAFVNAKPGQNSAGALVQLQRAFVKGTPKYLMWMLGMNDGDNGTVNASWLDTVNTVVNLCSEKNIELILCTIPNTPIIDNTYKNTWIKSSGYRYVDVCECVGSDLSTSWYAGLLSTDNVHPTDAGADVIAGYICASVPEMR